jgi:hypothetical protein
MLKLDPNTELIISDPQQWSIILQWRYYCKELINAWPDKSLAGTSEKYWLKTQNKLRENNNKINISPDDQIVRRFMVFLHSQKEKSFLSVVTVQLLWAQECQGHFFFKLGNDANDLKLKYLGYLFEITVLLELTLSKIIINLNK